MEFGASLMKFKSLVNGAWNLVNGDESLKLKVIQFLRDSSRAIAPFT